MPIYIYIYLFMPQAYFWEPSASVRLAHIGVSDFDRLGDRGCLLGGIMMVAKIYYISDT